MSVSLELRRGNDLEWRSLGSLRGFEPVEPLGDDGQRVKIEGQVKEDNKK